MATELPDLAKDTKVTTRGKPGTYTVEDRDMLGRYVLRGVPGTGAWPLAFAERSRVEEVAAPRATSQR